MAALEALNRINRAPEPEVALETLMDMPTARGQNYASDALQQRLKDADETDVGTAIELLFREGTQPNQRQALIKFLGALSQQPSAKQALIDWFQVETESQLLVLIGRYLKGDEL